MLSLALSLLLRSGFSQAEIAHPRLVRVPLTPSLPLTALLEAGLDVVGLPDPSQAMILEWPGDADALARLGARPGLVDEDPGRTAALRAAFELAARPTPAPHRVRSAARPDGVFRMESLPPFGSGSMGGFWTASEIKMKLDDLVAKDAHDVVADQVDTLGSSWQGRPIWGLKLGKSVVGPDARPVVFFNALTHAREPVGMQALLNFVDDLISKYGIDPFATYLLDHRLIYIVPLVNPDGYAENEATYFRSGGSVFGLWRKNTRDNNNNGIYNELKDGVDLNRNFSYRWGKDNTGSSKNPSAATYRGPRPFSEPESRAQRDIISLLRPQTGVTFHSFSDLLYHPWAHTESLVVDVEAFREWSDQLSRDNAYQSGGGALGLYLANGDFGDWCYGDTLLKPKVFMWTPEIGSDGDGFWPPPSRILALARENLRLCWIAAAIAGPFVREDGSEILEGAMNIGRATNLLVRARNLGASGTAGPGLIGTLTALDNGARVLTGSAVYPPLGPRQSGEPGTPFQIALDDTVTPGRPVRFQVDFTAADGLFSRDTISIPAGTPTIIASDDASSGLGSWSPGTWGIVIGDPAHPSRYFADSPSGNYAAQTSNVLLLNAPLNLSVGLHAYVIYEARWELEKNYDMVILQASLDGLSWAQVPATGTTPGSGRGEPSYAGTRWLWKPERADLSAFAGPDGNAVRLRFWLQSNGSLQFDGFNFDSMRILVYDPAMQPGPMAVGGRGATARTIALDSPSPNPALRSARLSFELARSGEARLEIWDVQGRRVRTLVRATLTAHRHLQEWDIRDEAGRRVTPGVYMARLRVGNEIAVRRLIVLE